MRTGLFLLVALALCFAPAASAQTSRGTVSGTVTDQTGAVVPGATITLTNTATTLSRNTVTNDEGVYRFDAVDLGAYTVEVKATNFGTVVKTGVEVRANQTSEINAQLSPAGQQVTVNVTGDAGLLLQTEAPVRGGNIEARKIEELPYAGRNPVSLALTLPGVSSNRYGFGVGTFSVNGGRGRSNNFLIDGTENNDISVAGQGFQIKNPDAVQEVSVQTSNYDAEFGRAGGAVVNVITKSGTNDFHGALSYLLDSTRDDAITNTQGFDPNIVQRGHPPFGIDQWFSGALGGPVLLPRFGEGGPIFGYNGRNKTFFFFSYQEQRQRSSSTFNRTVPSAAGRAQLRALFPVGVNPRVDTYLALTEGVTASTSLFNIALGLGRPDIQFGTGAFSLPATFFERQVQVRIDHQISANDQFAARYLFADRSDPQGGTVSLPGFTGASNATFQNFLLSETHVFSPSMTNELRLAYNRILYDFPINNDNPLAKTLPRFDITSISSLGVATNFPQGRVANNYVLQDTVTYLRGNHTFRFGLDLLKQRSRQFAPIVQRGLLTFASGGGFTGFANFVDNFGGSGGGARIDFGSPKYYPFLFRQAYFFQDRWRVTKELTLTLGLRYENFGNPINSLRTAVFTGLFNVDPVTFQGPYSEPNEAEDDNNNFAPTFGLAWSPSFEGGILGRLIGQDRTVFRAGYQIGYDSFFNNIASNAATSSPNVVATNVNSVVGTGSPRGLSNVTGSLPTVARPLSPLDSQTLVVRNLKNPYYQRWSVGFQRALPYSLVLDASYVGSKGTGLFINEDLNPQVPAPNPTRAIPIVTPTRITPAGFTGSTTCTPGTAGCLISGRLDNLQGSRLIRTNGGSSIYHSGQFELRRRFVNGFAVTLAYTWSKLLDNASEVFGVGETNLPQQAAYPSIFGGQPLERAFSFFDRTHRASITYVYELPFMRDQRGFVGRLVGGWQISGVTTFESGVPLTVVNGQDADGVGGNLDRPLFNPAGQAGVRAVPVVNSTTGAITGYVNPDAGNAPIDPNTARYIGLPAFNAALPLSVQRFGSTPRNSERTPGTNNWNLNIQKLIRLTESTRLELRTEFYNVFNHPQYGQGSVSPFSPGDQGISANVFNSNPGRFLVPQFADGGGRVIRYQVKFVF